MNFITVTQIISGDEDKLKLGPPFYYVIVGIIVDCGNAYTKVVVRLA